MLLSVTSTVYIFSCNFIHLVKVFYLNPVVNVCAKKAWFSYMMRLIYKVFTRRVWEVEVNYRFFPPVFENIAQRKYTIGYCYVII